MRYNPWVNLEGFFSRPVIDKASKSSLVRGRYMRYEDFLKSYTTLYEYGAALGCSRSDKLLVLAKMLTDEPGDEVNYVNNLQDLAKKRLELFRKLFGREPDHFVEFIYAVELGRISLSLNTEPKRLKKEFNKKVSYMAVFTDIHSSFLEGIGFGGCFPKLMKEMHMGEESMETVLRNKVGSKLEDPIISYEEREKVALHMTATYASQFHPELVDELNLRSYLT